jgi:hypothetical protein
MPVSRWKVTTKDRKSLYVKEARFRLAYPKGEIVIPSKSAPGIFVFDTRASAELYIKGGFHYDLEPRILRVLPIGKAIKLKSYRPTFSDNATIFRFWQDISETIKASENQDLLSKHLYNSLTSIERIDGTIIYPAVRVVD